MDGKKKLNEVGIFIAANKYIIQRQHAKVKKGNEMYNNSIFDFRFG